jgi:molecular chaperone GrpE
MTDPKKGNHHIPKPASAEASSGRKDETKPIDPLAEKVAEAKKQDSEVRSQESAKADEEAKKKIEELTNHLARCMADLQNYRRRSEEDKGRFVKFANAEMLKVLLPALENLDRSCKHLPDDLKENSWTKGVLHTQADLAKALERIGVKRIVTVGQKIDLKFHEALIAGPGEKDIIVEELDPGYTLNGETIKAAKVKVGDGSK